MTTKIGVYQLVVNAHIGVTEAEQAVAQPLSIDLELMGDICTDSDRLDETVDYDALARKVIAISRTSRLKLIETLADKVACGALEEPRVRSVRVRVKKCHPPLEAIQGGFVVEIRRDKVN